MYCYLWNGERRMSTFVLWCLASMMALAIKAKAGSIFDLASVGIRSSFLFLQYLDQNSQVASGGYSV